MAHEFILPNLNSQISSKFRIFELIRFLYCIVLLSDILC